MIGVKHSDKRTADGAFGSMFCYNTYYCHILQSLPMPMVTQIPAAAVMHPVAQFQLAKIISTAKNSQFCDLNGIHLLSSMSSTSSISIYLLTSTALPTINVT